MYDFGIFLSLGFWGWAVLFHHKHPFLKKLTILIDSILLQQNLTDVRVIYFIPTVNFPTYSLIHLQKISSFNFWNEIYFFYLDKGLKWFPHPPTTSLRTNNQGYVKNEIKIWAMASKLLKVNMYFSTDEEFKTSTIVWTWWPFKILYNCEYLWF